MHSFNKSSLRISQINPCSYWCYEVLFEAISPWHLKHVLVISEHTCISTILRNAYYVCLLILLMGGNGMETKHSFYEMCKDMRLPFIQSGYYKCCHLSHRKILIMLTLGSSASHCAQLLTHWGWVTHICASKLTIIGSDNGLSTSRRQAIIWTSAGILLIQT